MNVASQLETFVLQRLDCFKLFCDCLFAFAATDVVPVDCIDDVLHKLAPLHVSIAVDVYLVKELHAPIH
jgi:hypothetical protein